MTTDRKRDVAERKVRTAELNLEMARRDAEAAASRYAAKPTRENEHKAYAARRAVEDADRQRIAALRVWRALTQEVAVNG